VPSALDLTLDEYFCAGALIGLLSSQAEEPDPKWCRDWAFTMGQSMANEARRRRRQRD
jgi:hypothetical protein